MKSARKAAKANADYQKTMAFMEEKERQRRRPRRRWTIHRRRRSCAGKASRSGNGLVSLYPCSYCCPLPYLFYQTISGTKKRPFCL